MTSGELTLGLQSDPSPNLDMSQIYCINASITPDHGRPMQSITFRQLHGFVQLCRSGSFTSAAGKIGLTQSGLSLLIKALEQSVATPLVAREARPLRLTEAGERFLPLAERILDDIELAETVGRSTLHERITVAALPTLSAALLPDAIVSLRKTCPDVIVQIRDVLTDDIIARVRSGDAHIGLGAFLGYGDDLVVWPLFRDRLVALVPTSLFARRRTVDWPTLAAHPLILMGRDSNIRKLTELAFLRHRLDVRPSFEVQLVSTGVALVRAGLGIAIVPRLEAELVQDQKVRVVELEGTPLWREIGVLTRRGTVMAPILEQLVNLLRQQGDRGKLDARRATRSSK